MRTSLPILTHALGTETIKDPQIKPGVNKYLSYDVRLSQSSRSLSYVGHTGSTCAIKGVGTGAGAGTGCTGDVFLSGSGYTSRSSNFLSSDGHLGLTSAGIRWPCTGDIFLFGPGAKSRYIHDSSRKVKQ